MPTRGHFFRTRNVAQKNILNNMHLNTSTVWDDVLLHNLYMLMVLYKNCHKTVACLDRYVLFSDIMLVCTSELTGLSLR